MVLSKLYAALAVILFLSGLVVTGIFYFNYSQKKLAQLALESQTRQLAIEQQSAVIKQLQEDQAKIVELIDNVSYQQSESARRVVNLEERFRKQTYFGERDIGFIAENKPNLVQKVINNATTNALRCIEAATGIEHENLDCD